MISKYKIGIAEYLSIVGISICLLLTFYYDWWSHSKIQNIDYIIYIVSVILIPFYRLFTVVCVTFGAILFGNIYGFTPIYSNLFLIVCSYLIGLIIIKALYIKEKEEIENLFLPSICLGLAFISLSINIFSFFKINTPLFYFIFFSSITLLSIILNFRFIVDFIKIKKWTIFYNDKVNIFLPTSLYIIFFYVILKSLIPESSTDGLATHLALPEKFLQRGIWPYDVTEYIWAVQPFGGQWLFSFLNFFGGNPAVKLFSPIILLLMFQYLFQSFKKKDIDKNISFLLSILLISTPLTLNLIDNLHVDILHALIILVIFVEVLLFKNHWRLISCLVGFAFLIKSSTILIIPGLLIIYIVKTYKAFKIKDLLINLCLVIAFGALPYLTAFLITGSPTFPQYNEIFQSPLISKVAFYHPAFANDSLADFFYTTFSSKNYGYGNGSIGLAFIFFTALYFFKNFYNLKIKEKFDVQNIILFFSILFSFIIMFKFQAYLRYIYYLLPAYFFLILLDCNSFFKNEKIFKFIIAILILVNILKFDKIGAQLFNDYKFYVHKEYIEDYDLRSQPLKRLSRYLNEKKEFKGKKIFIFTKYNIPKYAFFKSNVAFWNWHSSNIQLEIITTGSIKKALKNKNFNYLIIAKDFDPNSMIRFFKDSVYDVGVDYSEFDDFIIKKIN